MRAILIANRNGEFQYSLLSLTPLERYQRRFKQNNLEADVSLSWNFHEMKQSNWFISYKLILFFCWIVHVRLYNSLYSFAHAISRALLGRVPRCDLPPPRRPSSQGRRTQPAAPPRRDVADQGLPPASYPCRENSHGQRSSQNSHGRRSPPRRLRSVARTATVSVQFFYVLNKWQCLHVLVIPTRFRSYYPWLWTNFDADLSQR
jgi:hypothetical protein